jgi:hypothetical protein
VVGWWVYWYGFRYKLIQTPYQAMDTEVGRQILVEMWSVVGALGDKGGAYWLPAAAWRGIGSQRLLWMRRGLFVY